MIKQIVRSTPVKVALAWLLETYMRLAGRTARWRYEGLEAAQELWRTGQPVIFACWHGQLLLYWKCVDVRFGAPRPSVIASKSLDGEIISRAVGGFGIGVVRGSSAKDGKQKGGSAALREMLRLLQSGRSVCFTPDGPRGPGRVAAPGIAQLAKMSGAAVLPVAWCARGQHHLNRWDRFALPPLFARAHFIWGPLMRLDRRADAAAQEAFRAAVEAELNRISAAAADAVKR